MGQITEAVDSIYKAGDVVTVTDDGQVYSTYRDMAFFLGLSKYHHGWNHVEKGEQVTVVASAIHESNFYGEVIGVRTANGDEFMIGYRGISEPIQQNDENGQPVLTSYSRVRLVTQEQDLLEAAAVAPDWALYVGQDDFGIFFFDHHPYQLNRSNIVRGLLPSTHKMARHGDARRSNDPIAVRIADVVGLDKVVIGRLRKELAEAKAALWIAEQKLNRIKGIVE